MAITDIDISETLEAGAPSIIYRGDQRPVDFYNEGGIAGVRQPYGFGSFVKKALKKVTRPIKKIIKSPVGKAALLGAGIYGLGGGFGGPSAGWGFSPEKFKFANIGKNLGAGIFGRNPVEDYDLGTRGLLQRIGLGPGYGNPLSAKNKWMLGGLGAVAAPFLAPALAGPVDETIEGFATGDQDFDFDYAQMRKDIGDAVSSGDYTQFTEVLDRYNLTEGQQVPYWDTLAAEGGRIGYDEGGSGKTYEKWLDYRIKTIAKGKLPIPFKEWKKGEIKMAHGGSTNFRGADSNEMLNLGGLEKDYRFDGGFVPIGEYEKKDDVPARLSKNEFVFTADAVRAAGGGNVNKGAQRMYDTMKKLESRVA